MGRLFLEHMGGTRIFSCANCETYLTNRAQLLSTRFTGATGRAFLFHRVVNLDQSDALERIMLTGKHMLLRRNDVGRVTLEWLTAAMASHLSRHWSAARSQDSTRLKAGTYATVSRDLVAQVPGELDLSGGECVLVLEPSVEDVWARVRVLNDASRMGLCPTTYLEPYGQAMAETSVEAKAAHVLYDFSATDDGVLPLQAGSIVFVTSDLGDGWLQGYDSSGHHGMFPANYISYSDGHSIEPLHTDAYHSHVNSGEIAAMGDSAHSYDTAATASSSSNFEPDRSHVASSEDVRMVLYDFNTGVPGDLQISAGEKVAILSWLSDEWAVAQSLSHLEQVGNIPITFISKENELESAVAHEIGAGQEVSSTAVSNSDHWSALSDIDLMMLENLNSAGSMPARHSVPSFQSDDPFSVFSEPASSAMHETTQSSAPMRPPPPPVAKSFTLPASENDGQPVNNAPPAVQRQSGGGMAVEKWGEHRRRVLNELIITEKGFARCMCACIDALTACALERWSKHVDCAALKDGLDKVLELSNRLLPKLEAEQWKGDDRQSIGGAFLQLSTDFHKIYSEFWPKNDKATELLTKYASDSTCRNVLSNILASIQREDPACVDLNTAVCRPVARMLKYPLFIHELLKVTPPSHADHVALAEAHAMLTDVAKDVNEMKRRKFLVVKYRKAESAKIGDRLSKLNMHSVKKKGSRFGVRLSSTIGLTHLSNITSQRHDAQFETLSHDYQKSRQSAAQFQKDVRAHCDRAHHVACRRRALAENWATLVADDTAQRGRGLAFREAWRKIAEECLPVYFAQVQKWVRGPLDSMLKTFDGPDKLIVKRNDKLLDYESISSKTKSGPDAHRLLEQQRLCEAEFAALNAQLIEDLPIMIDVISIVTAGTIGRLLRAQRDYSQTVWEVLKPFAPTNVRMGGSDASDDLSGQVIVIEDCFASERAALVKLIKLGSLNSLEKRMHSFLHPKVKGKKDKTVIRQSQDSLHRLSDDEQSVSGLEKSGSVRSSWRAFVQSRESKKTKQAPSTPSPRFPTLTQSPADQFSLVTKYSPADLYRVTASCLPLAGTESSGCDLSVRVGDVCAAVVRKDPMGEPDRCKVAMLLQQSHDQQIFELKHHFKCLISPQHAKERHAPCEKTLMQQMVFQTFLSAISFRYVDIGIDKGFVPSRVLQLLTEHDRSEILHRGQNMQNGSAGSHAPLPVSAPVVMRPPQPAMKQPSNPLIDLSPTAETARSSTQQNLLDLDWSWSIGRQVGESQFFRESDRGTAEESTMQQQSKRFSQPAVFSQAQPSAPSRAAPPPPPQPTSATQNRRSAPLPPTTTGVTSPALQPVRAAPPPPPPPVQHRQSAPAAGAAQGQGLDFYVSDFEFDADSYGSPGCISLAERQVVCVIKKCDLDGNDEWWLVKDEHGNSGYVPYGFLRKLDSVQ